MKKMLSIVMLALALTVPVRAESLTEKGYDFTPNSVFCTPNQIVSAYGQVTDAVTGAAVYRANISLVRNGVVCATAVSNQFGNFSVGPVFTESHLLTVDAKGYQAYAVPLQMFDDTEHSPVLQPQ